MYLNLKDYPTKEELADKIQAEGGIADFFLFYDPAWDGTELEEYVKGLEDAYLDLRSMLEELDINIAEETLNE